DRCRFLFDLDVEQSVRASLEKFIQAGDGDPLSAKREGFSAVGGEGIAGVELLHVGQGAVADSPILATEAKSIFIVVNDNVSVAGGPHIQFQIGYAAFNGRPEGGEGVLRVMAGASPVAVEARDRGIEIAAVHGDS